MGFRFHKSFKLLSGIRLNMSKSGPSVSVGGKGLSYNFGLKRNRASVGLPGTGVSYQTTSSNSRRSKTSIFGLIVMVLAIGYAIVNALSDGKISLAHWQDLLTQQTAHANKEDQKTAEDDENAAPVHHKRKHHSSVRNASDEN